jgi:small neutral amino acid transporter SnatA (MarC family)
MRDDFILCGIPNDIRAAFPRAAIRHAHRISPPPAAPVLRIVVPLGTPLIVGPAVLTTPLTLARSQGYALTLLAFGLNLGVIWAAPRWAAAVVRVIGEAGTQAVAKVFGLRLAAIGVTLIRRGLELTLWGAYTGLSPSG